MFDIIPIPAFDDNYIWAIVHPLNNQVVIVDPGDAKPVKAFLQNHGLSLQAILITHHHHDHTGGLAELCQTHECIAYGPSSMEPICQVVEDGDSVQLFNNSIHLSVIASPGHTLDHLVYYGHDWLFSGDTLFSAGCGRLFEGTAEQLWQSLQKLQLLPNNTAVYCAHEYTLDNLYFAQSLEPNNRDITIAINQMIAHACTLPSTIGQEKRINPYFRTHLPEIQKKLGFNDSFQSFKKMRSLKDTWQVKS